MIRISVLDSSGDGRTFDVDEGTPHVQISEMVS